MIISCPACRSRYTIAAHMLESDLQVRCRKCSVIFSPPLPDDDQLSKAFEEGKAVSKRKSRTGETDQGIKREDAQSRGFEETYFSFETEEKNEDDFEVQDKSEEDLSPYPCSRWSEDGIDLDQDSEESLDLVDVSDFSSMRNVNDGGVMLDTGSGVPMGKSEFRVRLKSTGETIAFKNDESARLWIQSNPGINVLVSSDGISWRRPEDIFGLMSTTASTGSFSAKAKPKTGIQRTTGSFRGHGEQKSYLWFFAAITTSVFIFVVAMTLERYQIVDTGIFIPVNISGLIFGYRDLNPSSSWRRVVTDKSMERYQAALSRGDRHYNEGKYLEAINAYLTGLEAFEGVEAINALIRIYEKLGYQDRAQSMRIRLLRRRSG